MLGQVKTGALLALFWLLLSAGNAHGQTRLASLQVGGAGELTPAYGPDTFHYGLRCAEQQSLQVSASADAPDTTLWLNGRLMADGIRNEAVQLAGDEDLVIELAATGEDDRTAYVVHCIPPDFPDVTVERLEPGVAEGLLLLSPYYSVTGADKSASYIAMLDNNGVPHFQRQVEPGAHNFRWHPRARRFSYANTVPNGAGEVVLLDGQLEEVDRVGTVGDLAPAIMHEFLITDEGNYLFISNVPVTRDLSRYPGSREDKPAPTTTEETIDAVIQEVTPEGEEVFRWNAWDHLKISDCLWWLFPGEYAKLNGIDLVDGDLVLSFRGCSQALKIERPSGRVLWQLGGTDPGALDTYDSRRPVFDRPFYRVTNDPRGGFCAQHTVLEVAPGRILLFDNGQCGGDERRASRVVEYALGSNGEATFQRHHEPGWFTAYGGAVSPLENGNWLIAWGGSDGPILSEVDHQGREVLVMRISRGVDDAFSYRAYRLRGYEPPWQLPR